MKVLKNDLLTALEAVKIGLASKALIEQSTHFIFLNKEVITFNDEIGARHPFDIGFNGAVSAPELLSFLSKVKADELEIILNEAGTELLLKSGRVKAGLVVLQEVTLPFGEITKATKWVNLPENFTKAINFSMGACSTDMTRAILTCVHINSKFVEGSDSFRIAKHTLSESFETKDFLLPATICAKINRLPLKTISVVDGWVHFKTAKKTVISCRIMHEEYPDTAKFFKIKGTTINFPPSILEILDRASVFSKRDFLLDEAIEINITEKNVKIKSTSDAGWFEETAKAQYTGEPLTFSVTPHLLRSILEQSNTALFENGRILFSGENWKFMTSTK